MNTDQFCIPIFMPRLYLIFKSCKNLLTKLVVFNFKMTNWIFRAQKSMEQAFAVLVYSCTWACFVSFESFFENLVWCFSNKIFDLPKFFFLLLNLPLFFVYEAWFKAFVVFITWSCLSFLNSLLTLVILSLLKCLSIHSVVVLFWPNIFPLLHFLDYVNFRLRIRTYSEKIRMSRSALDLFVNHFKFNFKYSKTELKLSWPQLLYRQRISKSHQLICPF